MPQNFCIWIGLHKSSHERLEADPLCGREIVFRREGLVIQSADKANADAIVVVAFDMASNGINRAARLDLAIAPDDVMVSDILPALRFVPLANVGSANIHHGAGS